MIESYQLSAAGFRQDTIHSHLGSDLVTSMRADPTLIGC
ncbi:MAG: hypothetical protein OJF52_000736 [Nitrospira sp.]|nr:MAG: hypothetical protein OJF52_000736 [Nitrospira sp.]